MTVSTDRRCRIPAALLAAALLASCAGARPPPGSGDGRRERPVLGPLQAALLYHQRSLTAPPDDQLVRWFGEVCGELDPAARLAAADRARASLAEVSASAASTARWIVPVRQTLGGYDLRAGSFPTSLRKGAVVRFGRTQYCDEDLKYLVVFKNGGAFSALDVPRERALEFVRGNPGRQVVHELEVEVVGAQRSPAPTLVVDIVRLRTRDAVSGAVLSESRGRTWVASRMAAP